MAKSLDKWDSKLELSAKDCPVNARVLLAGMAMQGLMAHPQSSVECKRNDYSEIKNISKVIAKIAAIFADSMLEELEK
jgi:hypothetical protein